MNYPRYPEYKPSGVEWLGEVPAHWTETRLKNAASIRVSNVDKKAVEGQEAVRLCNYVDVYYHDQITPDIEFMKATATPQQIEKFTLRKGDVLITKDSETPDDIAVPSLVVSDLDGVVCGYHLALIRPEASVVDGAYLARELAALGVRDQFHSSANGITRFGLSVGDISCASILVPPLDEQRTIAAFLDRETARIDALIAKKQRLVELLAEKRTALISQAVTKGLNPDAPMRDSGVEWLGEIPAHWKKKKFHYLLRLMGGITPDKGKTEYWEGDVPWMTPKDMKVERIGDSEDKLTQLALSETNIRLIEPGAVLVVVRGMILVHTFPVAVTTCRATINQDMKALIPVAMFSSEYLAWLLRGISSYILSLVEESAHGTKALRTDQFQSIEIYLPSLDEQNAIVSHINVGTARLDELCTKIESAIEQLKEYRAALIADAVTGKIDVRSLVKKREVA